MDPTEDILYRGFYLNESAIAESIVAGAAVGSGISGCVTDSIDISDVDVVQFMEKRSQRDGMDVGDVQQGVRRIRIAGTLYDTTRALLFDRLMDLRAALNPVLAQRDEPADRGYQPFYFSVPTNRFEDYVDGAIPLRVLAMPRSLSHQTDRDQIGGEDEDSLAIPWQATLICREPTIQAADATEIDLSAGGTVSGTLNMRGNYLTPVNMLFNVGAAAGQIAFTVGDGVGLIQVPASTGSRIVRFNGDDGILTIEEDSIELLRMDTLFFDADSTWPLISPGSSAYNITYTTVTPTSGSKLWFYERYA